jgi:glycosyltransferase involved in cell wall biosynthesis
MLSSVSVFFPCYNDSNTIRGLVQRAASVLPEVTSDYEIIVVDDGSSDNSLQVLEAVAHELPNVHIVRHVQNRGYGSALTTGFAAATKDYVFYTDGDGQYDPGEILLLAPEMKPGIDVVNGYKRARQDPWYRSVAGGAYQQVARILFSLPIRDVDCDFRLVRREMMRDIELTSRDGAICVELVRKLKDSGAKMVELPVSHYPRAFGTSQFFKPVRIVRALAGVGRWYVHLVLLREQKRRVATLAKTRVVPLAEPVATKAPD